MGLQRKCYNPLCSEAATPSSRYCGEKCQRNLATRRHRNRKRGVILKMKLGDERFEKRRASLRREILMTRINEMPVTKQMLDRGIQFALEWTLGIPTQDMNEPSDGLYVEWMLNVNYGTREMRVAEALKSGIQIPEKGD